MVIEQLIFTFISFAIFVSMFFRMIRRNDTTYVIILVLEAIGIALNFLDKIKYDIFHTKVSNGYIFTNWNYHFRKKK